MSSEREGGQQETGVLRSLPPGARVLAIRLRSMGDTVLMTPALRLLHQWRPDLLLSVLVEPPWNELLEHNPAIHSVIALQGKLRTAWRVRHERFSLVINLHGGPTSAFFTRLSGARWRAGFAHYRDTSAYNLQFPTAQQILHREGTVHTAEHVASCMFWLGVPHTDIPPAQVFHAPASNDIVTQRLATLGLDANGSYAVIHPTAAYPTKQWTATGFAEIGVWLENQYGLRPVYICGPGEASVLDEIERVTGHPILRAEAWSIRELIALMARSRVFVGNDSGPAHIAAAAGILALVIFGSSHSAVWRPWRVHSAVVQNHYDCNPCPGDRCYAFDEPRCILSITTAQVREQLAALLNM